MTVEKVISADDARSTAAWQLPDVHAGAPAPRAGGLRKPGPSVEEIERIQQSAYDEAFAQGLREGREQGYGEGLAEGRKRGEAEARERVQRLDGILASLAAPAGELDDAAERELAELALALSRQIIRRELQTQPGEVIAVVREAVALLPLSAREVRIRLNPEDAEFIRETLGDGARGWNLEEDPSVTRGGCHVNTAVSHVDATVEHRIAELAAGLLGDARRAEERGPGRDGEDGQ